MVTAKSTAVLARKLGVSRSSLYYKPKKPKEDAVIEEKILALQNEHPAYGYRRMASLLVDDFNLPQAKTLGEAFALRRLSPMLRSCFSAVSVLLRAYMT